MKKEADLYLPIKEWLEQQSYEVYAEVELRSRRVDVIGYRGGNNPVAIEMKTSVSQTLIGQAIYWRQYFPLIYIAIPERKKVIPQPALHRLAYYGIGILEIYQVGTVSKVRVLSQAVHIEPRRKFRKPWEELLLPEHQTWLPGGSQGGGYVTQYALSMKRIKEHLERHGGWQTTSDIIEACGTFHWADDQKQMSKCLLEFESGSVDAEKMNGRWHFRTKKGAE